MTEVGPDFGYRRGGVRLLIPNVVGFAYQLVGGLDAALRNLRLSHLCLDKLTRLLSPLLFVGSDRLILLRGESSSK